MPPKYGELLMDDVIERMIETDIDIWIEEKHNDQEQLLLDKSDFE